MREGDSSSALRSIRRSAIVEHAAERLFAIVDDVAAYPSFLPWCLAAQIHERREAITVATLEVGIRGIRHRFTTRNTSDPPRRIDIALVEGPFRRFHAEWTFTPLADNAASIAFSMEFEMAGRAAALALGPLFEHIAETMVDAFIRRADAIDGPHPG